MKRDRIRAELAFPGSRHIRRVLYLGAPFPTLTRHGRRGVGPSVITAYRRQNKACVSHCMVLRVG